MDATINVNFYVGGALVGGNWNEFTSFTAGVLSADLIDDTGSLTGVGLEIVNGFGSITGSGTTATAGNDKFSEVALDYYARTPASNQSDIKFTGLTQGDSFTLYLAGHNGNSRDSIYTINGDSGGAVEYICGDAASPTNCITYSGTVPANGEISINVDDGSDASGYGHLNGMVLVVSSGGPDVTPPTVTGATIAADGSSITIDTDENVSNGAGGSGGFSLSTGQALTYVSGAGSQALVYSISPAVINSEAPTLAYTQPGDGWEDAAGNDLATFSGQAITNNSTVNPGMRQVCYDPTGTPYADTTLIDWAIFANFAALQAGTVLLSGQTAVAGGAGEITIDDDTVSIGTNYLVVASDPSGYACCDTAVPAIDLSA